MMTYIVVMILIVTIPELWFVSLSYSVIFIKKYIYQKQTLTRLLHKFPPTFLIFYGYIYDSMNDILFTVMLCQIRK